ncbi:MAG: AAA family ATPase [Phycisphaerales bacterium]
MRTIAIINQKGGCGKTTTAINLAGVFARRGARVLLVDLDPQSHCAAGLAIPEQRIDVQIGDAMLAVAEKPDKSIDWTRLLWRVSRNLDLAPSSVRLAAIEAPRAGLAGQPDSERRLDQVLTRIADQYDLCLIDCPPSIGLLTYNALVAANEVLIPVETGFFALQGASKQVLAIKSLFKRLNVAPTYRLFATLHNPDSTLQNQVLDEFQRRFGDGVIPVVVRHDPKLREAVHFGQPIIETAPDSQGAADYAELASWLLTNTPAQQAGALASTMPGPVAHAAAARGIAESGAVRVMPSATDRVLNTPHATAAAQPAPGPQREEPMPTTRAADVAQRLSRGRADEAMSAAAAEQVPASADLLPRGAVFEPRMVLTPVHEPRPLLRGEVSSAGLLGIKVTRQGVLFVQPASLGSRVSIAGDFNGWSPSATPMRLNPTLGVLEALVAIPAGTFQYRLVVDGRWCDDEYNPSLATNPYGERNNVVHVPAGQDSSFLEALNAVG